MRYRIPPIRAARKSANARKLRSYVAQCRAHCRARSAYKLCAVSRTVRRSSVAQSVCSVVHGPPFFVVQSVRNAAHNLLLFRCAVCAQCRAQLAALPPRNLGAMSRTVRNSSVVQSVRNIAYNLLPNAAPQAVQSDAMESTQIQALYEPPLAAKPQLSEKPHQGFESKKTAGKPGSSVCNFTVTLGLRATVVENGVRKTYRARYYNPATGRFMSRDPEDGKAKDPASLHKYLYANGDPVNAADPAGRAAIMQYQILTWRRERVATKVALDIGIKVAACYVALAGTVVADLEHSALGTGIGGAATVIDCGILAVLFF